MSRIFIFSILSCIFINTGISQNTNERDSLRADQWYQKGIKEFDKSKFEQAIIEFEKADEIFKTSVDPKKHFECAGKITECFWRLGWFDKAIDKSRYIIEESVRLFDGNNIYQAQGYFHLSSVSRLKNGRMDSALMFNNIQLDILNEINPPPLEQLLTGYNLRGIIYYFVSKKDSSLYYFEESRKIAVALYGENTSTVATAYNNMAIIHLGNGELDKAEQFLERALFIREENNLMAPVPISNIYKNLGNIYFEQERYREALNTYKKASEITIEAFGENHYSSADLFQNIGNSYNLLRNLDSAVFFLKSALKIYRVNYGIDSKYESSVYNNLGNAYLEAGEYKKAKEMTEVSLKIHVANSEENTLNGLRNYTNLAEIALRNNRLEDALNIAQKGILLNVLEKNSDASFLYTPKIENFIDYNLLWEILYIKGIAAERVYQESKDTLYLNNSFKSYQLVVSLIDSIKNRFNSERDRVHLVRKTKPVFSGALRTKKLILGDSENKEISKEFFEIVQVYKSSALSAMSSEIQAKNIASIPDSLVIYEKKLKLEMSTTHSSIVKELANQSTDTASISKLRNKLFHLEVEKEGLEEILLLKVPDYYYLKYADQRIDVEEIQRKLDDETSLVEYFESDSSIYAFIITKDEYEMVEIDFGEEEKHLIEIHINDIQDRGESDYLNAHELYQKLVVPLNLNSSFKNLIVVPDGLLWNVNFDQLITEIDTQQIPKSSSYLMNKHNISYAYSSYLLLGVQRKKSKERDKMLAFSYGKQEDSWSGSVSINTLRNSTDNLPGTSTEILAIAEFADGEYFYGEAANEHTFKSIVEDYSILHLAVHGETNESKPNESKLIFYAKGDSLEDGELHAFELYNMSLNAKLAVLSACNSGTGKLVTGEGLMSIGRAFSYAGVESLVLNRWEVSDITAPYIMQYFYEGLYKGMRKSEALTFAKNRFLSNDADNITSAPFYWAGFYVLGDDSPIVENLSTTQKLIWLSSIGLMLGVLGFLFYRRKHT